MFSRMLRVRRTTSARAKRRRGAPPWRPSLEPLEVRELLATFTVITTADNGDNTTPTAGSLRAAILAANADAVADRIEFNIPGPGPLTITPPAALPTITQPVAIDGSTQPGYTGAPLVELDGSAAGSVHGLTITAADSLVRGLAINRFVGNGIFINGAAASRNRVEASYIGTDLAGTTDLGNTGAGVVILSGSGNTVGGPAPGSRNIISGNEDNGVTIVAATGNEVQGNFIGTNVTGTNALGNRQYGVQVFAASRSNIIGTDGDGSNDASEGNVISGNGVCIQIGNVGTSQNVVAGNLINLNAAGTVALSNSLAVWIVSGASSNRIGTDGDGTSDVLERNVISAGSATFCVEIGDAGSINNVVAGNYIGLNAAGTAVLGGGGIGIYVRRGATDNRVGTDGDGVADAAERNVIAGSAGYGIAFGDGPSHRNVAAGNYVGLAADGTTALGVGTAGILLGSNSNIVGGSAAAQRNVISGAAGVGLWITGSDATGNVVAGNYIGTNAAGTTALRNVAAGILIDAGAKSNRIGTDGDGSGDLAERNVISGNGANGVRITGAGTDSNVVAGNFIGTNAAGTAALGNSLQGVRVDTGAKSNRIGTDGDGSGDAAERNVISGNVVHGVLLTGAGTDFNVVAGNSIGTNAAGTAAVANGSTGVLIELGAKSNRVGTDGNGIGDPNEGNLLSGNGESGLWIRDLGTDDNVVAGNLIGTNKDGLAAIPNASPTAGLGGMLVTGGARFNRVGTNADGVSDVLERNVISGNQRFMGLMLENVSDTTVAGNYIGTNRLGTAALPNAGNGIDIKRGSHHNYVGTNGDGVRDDVERNVISGNGQSGIFIWNNGPVVTRQNVVAGNYIGTDSTGATALGNAYHGVLIEAGARANRIGTDGDGVADAAERNVISGNVLSGVNINGSGTDSNIVAGNYLGTNAAGNASLGNSLYGVFIGGGARNNRIGGNVLTSGNVISGNVHSGVVIASATSSNSVEGNLIGTNAAGTAALGNGDDGVNIAGNSNSVGAPLPSARNVISGNSRHGVYVDTGVSGTAIFSNLIGTDASGNADLGNAQAGVRIFNGSGNSLFLNTIAYNRGAAFAGVSVGGGTGNTIRQNSIFRNVGLGIDLGNDGVTPNDPGDADVGANGLQNYPVLAAFTPAGSSTVVQGTLSSRPSTTYLLEFFSDDSTDGQDEGRRLLGGLTVDTDAAGNATFTASFPIALPAGHAITATATDPLGNTSEFSPPSVVVPQATIDDVTVTEGDAGTVATTFTVRLSTPSTRGVIVEYSTVGVSARSPEDYASADGLFLIFEPGETSKPITVLVNGDSTFEPDETFLVTLRALQRSVVIADGEGLGTIVNDDPRPSIAIDDVSQAEGDAGTTAFTFTVSLSNPSSETITVGYTTDDDTASEADGDFLAAFGTLTFLPGETTKQITVQVPGDATFEPDETFGVVLSGATNATIARMRGVGTIVNDDTLPLVIDRITINDGGHQRSNIETIAIRFSQPTDLAARIADGSVVDAVQLFGAGGQIPLAVGRYRYDADTSTLTIDLTIDGFGGGRTTMLADGRFQLRLVGALIAAAGSPTNFLQDTDGDPDGIHRYDFHRLQGDFDGNATVEAADQTLFLAHFGTRSGQAGYEFAFDLNGDLVINIADYAAFRRLLGRRV